MEPAKRRTSPVRVAIAAAVSLLPFATAAATGNLYLVPLAPALAAVMLRWVGSWQAWAGVGVALSLGATLWGGYAWTRQGDHCTLEGPLLPAVMVGLSVLAGALAGAAVVGSAGSAWRVLAGPVVAAVVTVIVIVMTVFLSSVLGLPSLLILGAAC